MSIKQVIFHGDFQIIVGMANAKTSSIKEDIARDGTVGLGIPDVKIRNPFKNRISQNQTF